LRAGPLPLPRSAGEEISGLASTLDDTGAQLFFDVSPLLEGQWTGIPVVAAGLAGALLAHLPAYTRFFLGTELLHAAPVAEALARRSGLTLLREREVGRIAAGRLPLAGVQTSVGVFPSVKPVRRLFDVEIGVCHDLSTLVLPQFHIPGNVDHHMESLREDLASNDLTICVSQATHDDLVAYLGVEEARLVVARNGTQVPAAYVIDAADALAGGVEPYFLILGTREPRKNVMLVFDMLARSPALLERHRFVFAGKMGWLEEQHLLPPSLQNAVDRGRILFTGFLEDRAKFLAIAGAEATIYPSIFEGFGLPVLESLAAGTPAVASWSSAIPEAGGDVCTYFDPLSSSGLEQAIAAMLRRRAAEGEALAGACRAHAARFTWDAMLAAIAAPLCKMLLARGAVPPT
jgi:glycosyltransferase involved in cell wall biosynthesis